MRCAIPPVVLESTPQADAVRGEQAVRGKENDDSISKRNLVEGVRTISWPARKLTVNIMNTYKPDIHYLDII